MSERLLIAMVGTQDSGKSRTWVELFEKFSKIDSGFIARNGFMADKFSVKNVKTKNKVYKLKLTDTKFVEIFLISGSPEERAIPVKNMIANYDKFKQANIVLCSIQYADNMLNEETTLNYFISEGYHIYIHWLNPGINGKKFDENCDLINQIQHKDNAVLEIHEVEKDVFEPRIQPIIDYIYDWAIPRV